MNGHDDDKAVLDISRICCGREEFAGTVNMASTEISEALGEPAATDDAAETTTRYMAFLA